MYTLIPGAIGFLVVLWMYVDSYLKCHGAVGCVPVVHPMTGELLLTATTMLGLHTTRAALADKRNADLGLGPVPIKEDAPVQTMPDEGAPPAGGGETLESEKSV